MPYRAEKKKRAKVPVKGRFKVRIITQPMPANPTLPVNLTLSTDPTPAVVTTMVTFAQMAVAKPATIITKSIPVTVYNLAQVNSRKSPIQQEEEGPSTPSSNNPFVEQQPKAAATATAPQNREDTPWPNTVPAFDNLFVERASWPIPL